MAILADAVLTLPGGHQIPIALDRTALNARLGAGLIQARDVSCTVDTAALAVEAVARGTLVIVTPSSGPSVAFSVSRRTDMADLGHTELILEQPA